MELPDDKHVIPEWSEEMRYFCYDMVQGNVSDGKQKAPRRTAHRRHHYRAHYQHKTTTTQRPRSSE